jgi:hypothetical protein
MTATYSKTYTMMSGQPRTLTVQVSTVPGAIVTRYAGFTNRDGLPARRPSLLPRLSAWLTAQKLRRDGYRRVA